MDADVAADGVLEVGDGFEDAASDAPAGDNGEEVFDGVEPGGGGGGEMEHPARMVGEPLSDLGVLVRSVIVGDGMDDLAGWDGAFDGVEEPDEFLVSVARQPGCPRFGMHSVLGCTPSLLSRLRYPRSAVRAWPISLTSGAGVAARTRPLCAAASSDCASIVLHNAEVFGRPIRCEKNRLALV